MIPPEREKPAPPQGRPSLNCIDSAQFNGHRPQEWHADLGLVDDDHTPDMRQGSAL
jgi:hypothetical protein